MKKIAFQDNRNTIFQQLKIARARANLTQSELAAKLQVYDLHLDQQMISKIENNTRIVTDYELACICFILKTDISEMLTDCYALMKKLQSET